MPQLICLNQLHLTPADFRRRALTWAAGHDCCAYYAPTCSFAGPGGAFAELLAVSDTAAQTAPTSLADLEHWLLRPTRAPRCGILSYDIKNEIEALHSRHPDGLGWPALHFFEPETWLRWRSDEVIEFHGSAAAFDALLATTSPGSPAPRVPALQARLPRAEYLTAVRQVQEDILNGEV